MIPDRSVKNTWFTCGNLSSIAKSQNAMKDRTVKQVQCMWGGDTCEREGD
jgi:hypothetical protein